LPFGKFERLYAQGLITLEDIRPAIASWVGHCKDADTWRLRKKVFDALAFSKDPKA
jgi:hypothetical protein